MPELQKNSDGMNVVHLSLLFSLRIMVGWHFLYEGIVKLLDPNWTSAGYLVESHWIFSGIFRWIADTPPLLAFVDQLNMWGLVFIGLGLFFGFMTRIASISGILLLFFYYIAIPPIPSIIDRINVEGNYLIVNKNLIELVSLSILALFPGSRFLSIDGLIADILKKIYLSDEENGRSATTFKARLLPRMIFNRREVLKSLASVPFFGVFVISLARRHGWQSFEERRLMEMVGGEVSALTSATMRSGSYSTLKDLKGYVPQGQIGDVKISRLVCGGNLISGFSHARDLIYVSPFLKQYFTDEKIIDTFRLCEASGINTAILRTDLDTIRVLNKYRQRGGKMQWIAQTYPTIEDPTTNIKIALDNGAVGAFVQGNIADILVRNHRLDIIENALTYIKDKGGIAGVAGHQLKVPVTVERAGLDPDFYMKTLHCRDYWSFQLEEQPVDVIDNTRDNYWCINPEETIEYMKSVNKPWIAYKVLAAGAIQPEVGFKYTFENGADFACVGMFDFQVVDNANTVHDVLADKLARKRPWMA